MEAVLARAEIRVCRLALVDDFVPVRVLSLQLVFEMDLLRRDQAERGVFDPEAADFGGQAHPGPELVRFVVSDDLLDVDRRRDVVPGQMVRIDDTDASIRSEPELPIGQFGCLGAVTAYELLRHSIGRLEKGALHRKMRAGRPSLEIVWADARQPAGHV